ncbi:DUF5052 family protein [Blautia wexlerae]|uniref:DUF5052 family protein n=1 Tax=Blautia wexlerae TaxID=418240 RepID=UPI003D97C00D
MVFRENEKWRYCYKREKDVPEDLPKMTKLMVDGKALYIHRANYQIIDKKLL